MVFGKDFGVEVDAVFQIVSIDFLSVDVGNEHD